MISGIVLAGGRSRRMGRAKALLDADGRTFLERTLDALRFGGCGEVVVVLNTEDPIIDDIVARAKARSTPGAGPGTEQIQSLRAGLRSVSQSAEAVLVLPVDHPMVKPGTVAAMIAAFRESAAPVVRPVHEGRRGHPVLFASEVFEELLSGELPEGARSVVRGLTDRVVDVEVDDRGVVTDIDTPSEYEKHFGESP
jgi:CTP:molybdopterin cytidylyltransferase MocA